MYKVLIVDDFSVDREVLHELLQNKKAFPNIQVVGACTNGREALDRMGELAPDLIISDIEMPIMNGLELARELRVQYPGVKLIFCSMHNEFSYAQKALFLGGYGYVLKPLELKELEQSVMNALDVLGHETRQTAEQVRLVELLRQSRPAIVERTLHDLLLGLYEDTSVMRSRLSYLGLPLDNGLFAVTIYEVDDFELIARASNSEQRAILSLRILDTLREQLDEKELLVRVSDSRFAYIHKQSHTAGEGEAYRLVRAAAERAQELFAHTDISVSCATSRLGGAIDELRILYEQCLYVLRFKYSMGKGKPLYYYDIPSSPSKPETDLNDMQKEVRYMLHSAESEDIRNYILQLFQQLPANTEADDCRRIGFSVMMCLQNVLSTEADLTADLKNGLWVDWEHMLKLETMEDLAEWLIVSMTYAHKQIQCREQGKNRFMIARIKEYVETRYTDKLTLETIAEDLFYSPNYLNYVFKQETGMTIYDFIIYVRMEKAKEMLADNAVKLYEIANQLGYTHSAYFSKLFKRHTGLTPKDYRERYA